MDRKLISIAEKMQARPAMYTFLERLYWSRAARKRAYRSIAAELRREGTVRRIAAGQVKKSYYKLRAQYRRIQRKINVNPALMTPQLNLYEADVYRYMSFIKLRYKDIRYKDSMENV